MKTGYAWLGNVLSALACFRALVEIPPVATRSIRRPQGEEFWESLTGQHMVPQQFLIRSLSSGTG
ncbi:hypothetical protein HRbin26_00173 [bacterium HR26]|nr:hypothetical protein HRbin26_00173 [bacterium HR26]